MSERTEQFQVGDRPRLEITVPNGSVAILAGDPGTVIVTLHGNEDVIGRFRVTQQGNAVVVAPEEGMRRWSSVEATAIVPAGTAVDARLANTDLSVEVALASLEVKTASGDVRAGDVDGDVAVKSASGDVKLKTVGGRVSVTAASGDVVLDCCRDDVQVTSASGDLVCGIAERTVQMKTASGDVIVRRFEGQSLNAKSLSGDVRVGIPAGRRLRVDCQSLSGRVRNEFELKTGEAGGAEEASLRVKTLSGDITFHPASD